MSVDQELFDLIMNTNRLEKSLNRLCKQLGVEYMGKEAIELKAIMLAYLSAILGDVSDILEATEKKGD